MSPHYTKSDFKNSLKVCGIKKGDTLFCHSNIGFFGFLEGAETTNQLCAQLLDVIFDVIGETGTFVVPSFTYSFGSDKQEKVFDVKNTPAKSMGIFSEFVRTNSEARRSCDPMFSVSAIGYKAERLVNNISDDCFGKGSFWDRFYAEKGKICNFNFDSASTFIHYVEKKLNVDYRYDQEFSGEIISNNRRFEKKVIYFCRPLNRSEYRANFTKFDEYAKDKYSKISRVGRGSVIVITAYETEQLINEKIRHEPYFLTQKY
jgi:aminoglycoside 3-N-acetyltransferase